MSLQLINQRGLSRTDGMQQESYYRNKSLGQKQMTWIGISAQSQTRQTKEDLVAEAQEVEQVI